MTGQCTGTINVTIPSSIICHRGVIINNSQCPWAWGGTHQFWVKVIPNGQTWTYQNCYDTLENTKIAIDNLISTGVTFSQC